MIYGIVRGIIFIIVLSIYLSVCCKLLRNKAQKVVLAIFCLFVAATLAVIPFENVFLSFQTCESAFQYQQMGSIEKMVGGANSELVFYRKSGTYTYSSVIFPKEDGRWKLSNWFDTKIILNTEKDDWNIIVYCYKGEDYYIKLFNAFDSGDHVISDNQETVFEQANIDYLTYLGYIDWDRQEYSITIDGTEYAIDLAEGTIQ